LRKYLFLLIFLCTFLFLAPSCTPVKKPLDRRTEFSKYLSNTEDDIRKEDWKNAFNNLENSKKAWRKIKPFLQLDIDHDYVNDIENNFTLLKGYIETKDKSNSLATILLIKENWENIGQM
jgi:hypothetical protein